LLDYPMYSDGYLIESKNWCGVAIFMSLRSLKISHV
jgi:hypothetical protein